MKPTAPAFDGSLIVIAMARDIEVRLAAVLAGDKTSNLTTLRSHLNELHLNLQAQAEGRSAARAVPVGAMVARLAAAIRDLGDPSDDSKLGLPQRGAIWRLGAELVRIARELPQITQTT
jgi:hypothetical protein